MDDHLLPSNATAFEIAASRTIDLLPRLSAAIAAIRTAKFVSIPDSFLPYLIYERGLGPVSAYIDDPRLLLDSGIAWQRVRGTPDAVSRALDWLGYDGTIESARVTRRRWHLFTLALDRVRDAESPDLVNIEGVVGLSVPARSHFYRAYHGYDVREAEWSRRKYSGARYSATSGARLSAGGTKWSFGRTYDLTVACTQNDLEPLGAWVDLPAENTEGWGASGFLSAYAPPQAGWDNVPWEDYTLSWLDDAASIRKTIIGNNLAGRTIYAVFRRADNSIIGYRRARVAAKVRPRTSGPYSVSGVRLSPDDDADSFYVEFLTDFGQGDGSRAASIGLLFDAVPTDASRPGLQWVAAGGLTGGVESVQRSIDISFGRTVRERVRLNLTF